MPDYPSYTGTSLGSTNPAAGGTLAAIIAAAAESLTDRATIERKTSEKDTSGTTRVVWNDLASDVPCKLDKVLVYAEKVEGNEERGVTRWQAKFPVGTDILPRDRVTIDEMRYQVVENDDAKTDAITITVILVRFR